MKSDLRFPDTLQEAITWFADPEYTLAVAIAFVWPNGVTCPHCGSQEAKYIRGWYRWRCGDCKKQYTVKIGTIFEDSPLGLDKWLIAIWMIANCKNGVSSYEVHRAIGVTQKTAWFMLHRIRVAMQNGTFMKLAGLVEADETFVGGLEKNKHESRKTKKGRGTVGKAVVAGMLERGGGVVARVVPDTSAEVLQAGVREVVEPGSALFTDAHRGYHGLGQDYMHAVVDHAYEYVREQIIHTNGMENFWSLLKRTIKGTYVAVDVVHLDSYLTEQAFRFNERHGNDGHRFEKVMEEVSGKRLTYKQLTTPWGTV